MAYLQLFMEIFDPMVFCRHHSNVVTLLLCGYVQYYCFVFCRLKPIIVWRRHSTGLMRQPCHGVRMLIDRQLVRVAHLHTWGYGFVASKFPSQPH